MIPGLQRRARRRLAERQRSDGERRPEYCARLRLRRTFFCKFGHGKATQLVSPPDCYWKIKCVFINCSAGRYGINCTKPKRGRSGAAPQARVRPTDCTGLGGVGRNIDYYLKCRKYLSGFSPLQR